MFTKARREDSMPYQQLRHLLRTGLAAKLLAVAALSILLFPAPQHTAPVTAQTPPQHLLLKLVPSAWETPPLALSNHSNLSDWEQLRVPGWVRVTVVQDHDTTLAALRSDPTVQAIEEDHRVRITLTPNDAHWDRQWGPEIVRAPGAWDVNTGSQDVIVAVLDTGIDPHHSDLAGQLWVNPAEVPGNGRDDDRNGQIDDIHGWRFLHDAHGPDESALIDDDHGHGTHVSGTIAARGNNARGIAGMAWGSRVMVVKVLDQNGDGYYSDLAKGLVYAADNGARVANLSLGGTTPSQILRDAVNYAHTNGTLVVASAGNSNSAIQYPAAYDNVLAVASSTRDDGRASYSCYGPEMDLTAPGTSILSTCIGGTYCYKSGTSMAAPHVSGLAALVYSASPTLTADQITQILRETAQDIGSAGWDPYTGWGRIDARGALLRTQPTFKAFFPLIRVDTLASGVQP
jgi:subtilisin family serine protease